VRDQNIRLEETVRQRTQEIFQQKELVEKTLKEKEELLYEKEVLLKEIHHRVKNNLQTISSILMVQSAGLQDEQAKKAIADSQSRVSSIALVHQKLYQMDGLEKVELNGFVKDLVAQTYSVYKDHNKEIGIDWQIPETLLLIDTAIPLGLILNELLTNSFKYAFHNSNCGSIRIELRLLDGVNGVSQNNGHKTQKVELVYSDSGPGFESIEVVNTANSLGMRLIKLLSKQVNANLNYSNKEGSRFVFVFNITV
jgi:two-component sensor histidine kinase